MMKLLALALVLSTSACAMTSQSKHIGIGTGVAMIATGVLVSAVVAAHHCDGLDAETTTLADGIGCFAQANMLAAIGVAIAGGGLATVIGSASARELPDAIETDASSIDPTLTATPSVAIHPNLEAPTPALRQLATKASIAAHVGHCEEVEQIAAQVQAIDNTYRYGAFLSTGTIADCL